MASRPIFIPCKTGNSLVTTEYVNFEWSAGMAVSQKQKSIRSLHTEAKAHSYAACLLEVSSKSEEELGRNLSAFNLKYAGKGQSEISVECLFQSSKVFEKGGPFRDLLYGSSIEAKRDLRLKDSGKLLGFVSHNGEKWPLEPKTIFYDWVYLNVLNTNIAFRKPLHQYDAFTDIEFNPKKSINCQAYSVALFSALDKRQLLKAALASPEDYRDIVTQYVVNNAGEDHSVNPRLI